MNTFTIEYADDAELARKLNSIASRLGFTISERANERVTVKELARRVGRSVSTVSRSLRRPSCPSFVASKGKRRLIWIEPNAELLAHLSKRAPKEETPVAQLKSE